MKPYLLTISSDTPGMARFRASLEKLGDNYEHIAIQFEPYTEMPTTAAHRGGYPGHFIRHAFIPGDLDPERHVIFCDTDDVIFQKPFPVFEQDMYLAPENVVHKDTIWRRYIEELGGEFFKDVLWEKEVFNCGMYVVKAKVLYEYRKFIAELPVGNFNQYNMEQMHFNYFIYTHPQYSRVIDLSILCPLYNNYDAGLVEKVDGIWKTKGGKAISCVHANGNNKEIL